MTATYGDLYVSVDKCSAELGRIYVHERNAARGKAGTGCFAIDRLWGSTRRCRESLEGVNQS